MTIMASASTRTPETTPKLTKEMEGEDNSEKGTEQLEEQQQKGKPRDGSEEHSDADPRAHGSPSTSPAPETPNTPAAGGAQEEPAAAAWQAIWSPQYNAYYFFNSATQETTWVNPLQPDASSSSGETPAQADASAAQEDGNDNDNDNAEAGPSTGPQLSRVAQQHAAMQAAALAQGIDPALAHLDPTLLQSTIPGASGPSDLPTFKAQFNARTGQFAPVNSRTPGHLSEFERAKRMSEFYFDVGKWEEDLAKRGGRLMGEEDGEDESGKKRKRPTKKDIERFKEQKRLKKIAKTAWLRT